MVIIGVAGAAAAGADAYKWVDEQGRVHYGQVPPPSQKAERVPLPEQRTESITSPKKPRWYRRDGAQIIELCLCEPRLELKRQSRPSYAPKPVAWGELERIERSFTATILGSPLDTVWEQQQLEFVAAPTGPRSMRILNNRLLAGDYRRFAWRDAGGPMVDRLKGRWRDTNDQIWHFQPEQARFDLRRWRHSGPGWPIAEGNWQIERSDPGAGPQVLILEFVKDFRADDRNRMGPDRRVTIRSLDAENGVLDFADGSVEIKRVWY